MLRRSTRLFVFFVAVSLAACGGSRTKGDGPGSAHIPNFPGDAVPKKEARSRYGNGPNYEVFGKRYTVMADSANYSERGVASWYGKKFHGNLTSNREVYDMYEMTAAFVGMEFVGSPLNPNDFSLDMEAMRERIAAIAHSLIDDFIEAGSGDLVRLFTHPLPVIVICDLLGVPKADQAEFVQGTRISGRLIDPSPMTEEELAQANESTVASSQYFEALCDERRRNPQDDLITALVESETEHGKLSKDELTSNIALLFAAGHETTVNLMGNALLALYRNRDQLDLLRADPALMPNAVEEFLRYDSSVQLTGRDALEDTEIEGVALPRGRAVLTLLGAANRDPAVFDDPDRLDITRERIKPLAFGGGIHLCLGAQLARIEAHIALSVLLGRLPGLELENIDNPDWKQTITLRGVKSQPVSW